MSDTTVPAAKPDPRKARAKYVAVQVAAHIAAGAVGFAGVWYGLAPAVAGHLREPAVVGVDCDWSAAANGVRDGCTYVEIEEER